MYIPKFNLTTDQHEMVAFMKKFSFATIITAKNGIPLATHLPFSITTREEQIILTSHFAKANNHWQDIENNSVLVIFSEPHAYISTKNYALDLNVPTWNYISIHAYGEGKLITDPENTFKVLEMMIDEYEESYRKKWDQFPMDYKLKMSKGIVAFEIGINDLQGKKKLSQNRTDIEKLNIIESLTDSEDSSARLIASYMMKESEK